MIQKPFNDADLIYNYEEHRYVPTTDFILRKTGIDLVNGNVLNSVDDANPSELGDRVLDEISAHIYATIYGMTLNENYVSFMLACDTEYRDRLKRVFVNEVRYALRAGDFWFTLDEMERANFITRDSVNLLNKQHSETGIRLLYRGRFNVLLRKVDWEW